MEAKILSSFCRKPAFLFLNCYHFKVRTFLRPTTPYRSQSLSLNAEPGIGGGGDTDNSNLPPPTPTIEIRFKRGSRRKQAKEQQNQLDYKDGLPSPPPPPKEWESMTITEKAIELYMGEKGLLFWLNKFAYASIFIVVVAWILFRFVGPSLGLYQLDSAPLSPSTVLKGS